MIKIFNFKKMTKQEKNLILLRSGVDIENVKEKVSQILKDIKTNGDSAVQKYTKKFDNVELKKLFVSAEEIDFAYQSISENLYLQIKQQIKYSKKFHQMQIRKEKRNTINKGIVVGERYTPIDSVGLYVPGGKAEYPTVLQILAVPAKIANVPRIVVCTPPDENGLVSPSVLVVARMLGIEEIYKIGGAQAIAALAYGTESIKPVKKIVGPGNIYVSCAKMLVFGVVDIDMIAGPSEAIIIADSTANPVFIASDILARCEHDPNASAVLLTDSKNLAYKVKNEISKQFSNLKRKRIIKESLSKYSAIIIFDYIRDIVDFTNEYAPEHLEIMLKNPWELLSEITNAGSIFLGNYAPVAVGDYASGTNHVLPTGQYAKMFSPVGVETFQKKSEFQYLSKEGLETLHPIIRELTAVEGLDAHYNSVKMRLKK
jgi:histidinol dehydrogenase